MSDNCRRSSRQTYSCDVCGKRFAYPSSLDEHRSIHVDEIPSDNIENVSEVEKKTTHVCSVCKKKCSSLKSLKSHMIAHKQDAIYNGEEKPFTCNNCQEMFLTSDQLNRHSVIHLKEKKYSCKICHRKFGGKTSWLHHVEKKICLYYTCNICSDRFETMTELSKHKVLCEDKNKNKNNALPKEEPEEISFCCEVCNKSFLNTDQLSEHECSGEPMDLTCEICKECFPSHALLKKHSLIHSDKPFQCNLCPRTFPRRNDMISHLRRVHANHTIYYNESSIFVE